MMSSMKIISSVVAVAAGISTKSVKKQIQFADANEVRFIQTASEIEQQEGEQLTKYGYAGGVGLFGEEKFAMAPEAEAAAGTPQGDLEDIIAKVEANAARHFEHVKVEYEGVVKFNTMYPEVFAGSLAEDYEEFVDFFGQMMIPVSEGGKNVSYSALKKSSCYKNVYKAMQKKCHTVFKPKAVGIQKELKAMKVLQKHNIVKGSELSAFSAQFVESVQAPDITQMFNGFEKLSALYKDMVAEVSGEFEEGPFANFKVVTMAESVVESEEQFGAFFQKAAKVVSEGRIGSDAGF
jgi:hypothetical protein